MSTPGCCPHRYAMVVTPARQSGVQQRSPPARQAEAFPPFPKGFSMHIPVGDTAMLIATGPMTQKFLYEGRERTDRRVTNSAGQPLLAGEFFMRGATGVCGVCRADIPEALVPGWEQAHAGTVLVVGGDLGTRSYTVGGGDGRRAEQRFQLQGVSEVRDSADVPSLDELVAEVLG